jgi:signal-transduction protein with cAMP-binding, CBS, and nucleotidyltransferase domain
MARMRIAELLGIEGPLHKQAPPLTCGQTVENAARRMERIGCRLLPICRRDGSLAGVLSERDIVVKVVARSRAPELCTVDEVMTTRFLSCLADDTVDDLRQRFESTGMDCAVVRHRGGELAGVLEARSLAGLGGHTSGKVPIGVRPPPRRRSEGNGHAFVTKNR